MAIPLDDSEGRFSKIKELLQGKGYDGIVYANEHEVDEDSDEDPEASYMAFTPEQIVPTTGKDAARFSVSKPTNTPQEDAAQIKERAKVAIRGTDPQAAVQAMRDLYQSKGGEQTLGAFKEAWGDRIESINARQPLDPAVKAAVEQAMTEPAPTAAPPTGERAPATSQKEPLKKGWKERSFSRRAKESGTYTPKSIEELARDCAKENHIYKARRVVAAGSGIIRGIAGKARSVTAAGLLAVWFLVCGYFQYQKWSHVYFFNADPVEVATSIVLTLLGCGVSLLLPWGDVVILKIIRGIASGGGRKIAGGMVGAVSVGAIIAMGLFPPTREYRGTYAYHVPYFGGYQWIGKISAAPPAKMAAGNPALLPYNAVEVHIPLLLTQWAGVVLIAAILFLLVGRLFEERTDGQQKEPTASGSM